MDKKIVVAFLVILLLGGILIYTIGERTVTTVGQENESTESEVLPSTEAEDPVDEVAASPEYLKDGEYVTTVKECNIEIPGVKKTYHFLYLSDMHILVMSDEVAANDRGTVQSRMQELGHDGHSSTEIFGQIISNANQAGLDGVLLGGDIIDFLSIANLEWLNDNLERLEAPSMLVTADHDLTCWWTGYSEEEQKELREQLPYEPLQVMDYHEFLIVGISNTTSPIQEEVVKQLKDIFALGKPVIIVQHVPIASIVDNELKEKSREAWNGKALLWGEDCSYEADGTTQEYLNMINDPESPVVAVLAGHLHFEYEGRINDKVKQYLFSPAYTGEVAYVTVKAPET